MKPGKELMSMYSLETRNKLLGEKIRADFQYDLLATAVHDDVLIAFTRLYLVFKRIRWEIKL